MVEVQFPYTELLYALRGYPGLVFTLKDPHESEFVIADSLLCRQMIHPSELLMASRLLPIASTNLTVRRVISQACTILCPYKNALYTGISYALKPYDDQLNCLQEKLFDSSKPLPIADFNCILRHEEFLLVTSHLLDQLSFGKTTLNQVISTAYEYTFKKAVSQDTRESFQTVFKQLLQPLMDDIWSFMIYGHLRLETKGVFFVSEDSSGEVKLHSSEVPTLIESRVATKILFVGKLVRLFNQGSFIFEDCCDELFEKVNSIRENFHEKSFAGIIERIRMEGATFSSAFVLHEEHIMAYFSIIKQILLTGNEKVWLYLVERICDIKLLNTWSDSRKERTMKQILEAIMLKFYYRQSEIDEFLKFFTISFSKVEEKDTSLPQLSVSIHLPLLSGKIIRPHQIAKYEKLFNFLLRLFLARHQLSSSWMLDMKQNDFSKDQRRSLFALRHKLILLIEHLYFYLKVNVIETLFTEFTNEFTNCCDYEVMQFKHASFISTLMRESLLDYPPCEKILSRTVTLCSQFANGITKVNQEHFSQELASVCREMSVLFSALKDYRFHSGLSHLLLQISPCLKICK